MHNINERKSHEYSHKSKCSFAAKKYEIDELQVCFGHVGEE